MENVLLFLKKLLKSQLYTISLYSRQLSGTVVLLFIARFLSVHDYGLFSSYKSIAAFLLIFANLGYNEYILVSSNKVVREVQLKIGFFIINAIATVIIITLFAAFTPLESYLIFVLVLWRSFFDVVFFLIMLPYFQTAQKFNIISYVNIFYAVATSVIAVICYIFKLSLVKFLVFGILLGLFNFVQVTYYAGVNYLLSLRHMKRIFNKIDKSIFAYIGTLICSYLYLQIPSLYISTFVSKEDAALYFAAFTVVSIIYLFLTAQAQKIIPEMMNVSKEKVNKIINYNLKLSLILNTVLLIFFAIFGKQFLVLLYGKEVYANAYILLLIFLIANFASVFSAIYGTYLTASKNQHVRFKMQIETIIISLTILALFHRHGINAAMLAYVVSATYIGVRYCNKVRQLIALKN